MSKIKEMFEAMINDPDFKNNPMFKESEKYGEALDELTLSILRPCYDYVSNHGSEDEGWGYTILIAMARATSKLLYGLQHTATTEGKDIYEFYHDELLPLAKAISYQECEEVKKMKEEVENAEKVSVPFDRRRDVIIAIADLSMSADDIIGKYFKKDMTDEQRKRVADHIEKVRVEHAESLRRIHEDYRGN
jgi:hypothetical protein